ncbi:vegetative incompatibility protein HET-E-1 [Parachaetomium inaequale]|uniref:Vegetative incompatibility protein HET-E-1 n=1 Tax=Parachaetomium inaequale TaxID=2588326 RepID=A0AAN6PEL4_9PEZI|nr:vegetative incompatibility protein HET-E-1 [Parachaetomium inaequale]
MRLINTSTLQLEEFFDASVPEYSILSHTWEKEEIIFPDMADLDKARSKAGFAKMEGACALAAAQGYTYIWIDTCCIDKSSSAELSEAINSMYRWYECSKICFAYLCDVKDPARLGDSRWFTRGWTLQELLAPSRVEFYTADWVRLGEKRDPDLVLALSHASLVDECVLGRVVSLEEVSVAKKFYWASKRTTTRREDEAYCLMGLFNVNMPLMYGEGSRAFFRLQQEITKATHDQSILAWYCDPFYGESGNEISTGYSGCYAKSPKCFALSGDITPLPVAQEGGLGQIDFTLPLRSSFSAILAETELGGLEAILCCQIGRVPGTFPTLVLTRDAENPQSCIRFLKDGVVSQTSMYTADALLAEARTSPITNTPHQMSTLGLWVGQSGSGVAGVANVMGLGGKYAATARTYAIYTRQLRL